MAVEDALLTSELMFHVVMAATVVHKVEAHLFMQPSSLHGSGGRLLNISRQDRASLCLVIQKAWTKEPYRFMHAEALLLYYLLHNNVLNM